ncbi:MAG: ABC transporter permease [Deltaproteobacteria bacterium]|nr:ABC transporter permease [Deltaproteobacteria bacterium]
MLGFRPVFLWSDTLIYLLLLSGGVWLSFALRREYWRVALRQVALNRMAMLSFGILCLYGAIGFLDTLHFRKISSATPNGGNIQSVLDVFCTPLIAHTEKTYSAPFAVHLFTKENMTTPDGKPVRNYPRLRFAGETLQDPSEKWSDIQAKSLTGLLWGLGVGLLLFLTARGLTEGLWVGGFLLVVAVVFAETAALGPYYHILGTDKTGQDVLYIGLKSVRTGLIIGTLTTLIVTPFAILCGVLAGYVGGWVDDVIQYVYSTLESIPDILLIAAAMLIFQVGLTEEETIISADKRLVYLCVIMGITSWTGLCRLLRAEVLKLREIEYVQAADAFGVSQTRIILRHLIPNVMHIVLISIVLRFSGLVLAEAVLAYVGIGVDPSMQSWGNMINQARLELAREPVVWWNLFAAFVFMLGLVLPANLFGDAVRDALDPRLRTR